MSELQQYTLQQWNRDIRLPTAVVTTGKRNTGKSVYGMSLLYFICDQADQLYVMCPTLKPREFENITSAKHIYRNYSQEVITDIMDSQKLLLEKEEPMPQIVILLDDCVFNFKKNDEVLTTLYVKGRHFNITPIILTQKFRLLNQAIRSNCDYCFCTRVINVKEKESIYEEYNDGQRRDEFFSMLDITTMNHGVLVIDNSTTEKQIYYKDRALTNLPDFYIENEVGSRRRRALREKKSKNNADNVAKDEQLSYIAPHPKLR